jgi:hypothetical protein
MLPTFKQREALGKISGNEYEMANFERNSVKHVLLHPSVNTSETFFR